MNPSPATSIESKVVVAQIQRRYRAAQQERKVGLTEKQVDGLLDCVHTEARDWSKESFYHCDVCQKAILLEQLPDAVHTSAVLPMRFVCHVQSPLSICPPCQMTETAREVQALLTGMRVPPDRGLLDARSVPSVQETADWPEVQFVDTAALEAKHLVPTRRLLHRLGRYPRTMSLVNSALALGIPALIGFVLGRVTRPT